MACSFAIGISRQSPADPVPGRLGRPPARRFDPLPEWATNSPASSKGHIQLDNALSRVQGLDKLHVDHSTDRVRNCLLTTNKVNKIENDTPSRTSAYALARP